MALSEADLIEYFGRIKANHRHYLERNMVSHLERVAKVKNAKKVTQLADAMAEFHEHDMPLSRYLADAIKEPTTAEVFQQGAVAALSGIGSAGLAYFAGARDKGVIGGTFSAALGVGVGAVMYKILRERGKQVATEDYQDWVTLLVEAGFKPEGFEGLSKDIVKLFHYRECLLLDLPDNQGRPIRSAFAKTHGIQLSEKNQPLMDMAIEVYFIQRLGELFNHAFREIYEVHEAAIRAEEAEHSVINWIKRLFQDESERERFTQQLQLEFMQHCVRYLEEKLNEPSWANRHIISLSSVTGLIIGLSTFGIVMACGGPFSLGLGLAVLFSAVMVAALYHTITKIDHFRFKRSPANQQSLRENIACIDKETTRLSQLIKQVKETTEQDLAELRQFHESDLGFVRRLLGIDSDSSKPLLGAASSWIREHATRYRHSKRVELDLAPELLEIIQKADEQSRGLHVDLANWLKRDGFGLTSKLYQMIAHTQAYLRHPENQDYIARFDIRQKVKQQFLELIASVSIEDRAGKIQYLIDFYTMPLEQGGLGGNEKDIIQICRLAPIVGDEVELSEENPYIYLANTAFALDRALGLTGVIAEGSQLSFYRLDHAYILKGDNEYRRMLRLPVEDSVNRVENEITVGNIDNFLSSSYDFLLSLKRKVNPFDMLESPLETVLADRDEYLLYRTLLIKQLATLADPNNHRIERAVKQRIRHFVCQVMNLDADVVFDHAINQSLFFKTDPHVFKHHDIAYDATELAFIGSVIRMDMAYCGQRASARSMLTLKLDNYFEGIVPEPLLAIRDWTDTLRPSVDVNYPNKLLRALKATRDFINDFDNWPTLVNLSIKECYIMAVLNAIDSLQNQITALNDERGDIKALQLELSQLANELKDIANRDSCERHARIFLHGVDNKVLLGYGDISKENVKDAVENTFKFIDYLSDISTMQLNVKAYYKQTVTQWIDALQKPVNKRLLRTKTMLSIPTVAVSDGPNPDLLASVLRFGSRNPRQSADEDVMRSVVLVELPEPACLNEFIDSLKRYKSKLIEEYRARWFDKGFFVTYSKFDKIKAVEALVLFLLDLEENERIDDSVVLSINNNPIYRQGRLGELVTQSFNELCFTSVNFMDLRDRQPEFVASKTRIPQELSSDEQLIT